MTLHYTCPFVFIIRSASELPLTLHFIYWYWSTEKHEVNITYVATMDLMLDHLYPDLVHFTNCRLGHSLCNSEWNLSVYWSSCHPWLFVICLCWGQHWRSTSYWAHSANCGQDVNNILCEKRSFRVKSKWAHMYISITLFFNMHTTYLLNIIQIKFILIPD